jgi:hypothetical protein
MKNVCGTMLRKDRFSLGFVPISQTFSDIVSDTTLL